MRHVDFLRWLSASFDPCLLHDLRHVDRADRRGHQNSHFFKFYLSVSLQLLQVVDILCERPLFELKLRHLVNDCFVEFVLVVAVENVGAAGEQAGVLRVPSAHWRRQVLSVHLVDRGACAFDLGVPIKLEVMACEQSDELPLYFGFSFALHLVVPFLGAPHNLEDLEGRLLKHLLDFLKLGFLLLCFLLLLLLL